MSASSSQQSTEAPATKSTGQLEIQVDAGEGDRRKVGTTKNPVISNILKNITGDEAMSNLVQSVAEIIVKLAKDNEEHTVVQNVCDQEIEATRPKIEEKDNLFFTYGPLYGPGSESILRAKDAAWDHIVQKSGPEAERDYRKSIGLIISEAMEAYDIPRKDRPTPEQFRTMMVIDGCFFIQLALHILGGGDHLGFSSNNPFFGKGIYSAGFIPDMFFPGNQIPYEVIRVLMKHTFFRDVINNGIKRRTWRCPDEGNIGKMALYLTVVKPELSSRVEPHSNVLGCLYDSFVGNGAFDHKEYEFREFESLEAGNNDNIIKFPSAEELLRSGIRLGRTKRLGIKNIRFRNFGYFAKIYLPTLTIENHTKDLLANLVKHEQNMNASEREVTAYLRFMRDLVHTHNDFKILADRRIIVVKDAWLNVPIVKMLDDLATLHISNFTLNFRHIRQRIADYRGPPLLSVSVVCGILTIAQTIITVLAYIHPIK